MQQNSSSWQQMLTNGQLWLQLGLGIKRWLLLLSLGAATTGIGTVYLIIVLNRDIGMPNWLYSLLVLNFLPKMWRIAVPIALLTLGTLFISLAVYKVSTNLVAPFRKPDEGVVQSLYDYSRRARGPHIVAIGGGTGMPTLLRGLKEHTRNITAIVTVADDGGSSGRLRRQLGVLPPGDFRNNIAALSKDEALMTQLLQYRFGGNPDENGTHELTGHALGNLMLAALTGITGSFDDALLAAERVLAMRGRVLPSTLHNVTLVADVLEPATQTTQRIVGESAIPKANGHIQQIYLEPTTAQAYPEVLKAIFQADLIVIGPGSLYTSILPNLLVPHLPEALYRSKAETIYVCNLATQPGETDNYSVADHVAALQKHISTDFLDIVLANNNLSIPSDQGGGQTRFVTPTAPTGIKMVAEDLVDEASPWRHDSQKLAKAIMSLL